jgi:phenylpropionate dioxygenase-like ring-hydroxylating dioxygenase large terminal subunit
MIADAETRNGWHVVARSIDVLPDRPLRVRLLEQDIELSKQASGQCDAVLVNSTGAAAGCSPKLQERYGLIWLCLGDPTGDVLPFPEFHDRRFTTVLCGPYGVATSALRVVENFLDMAHLPYVHTGILGQEPHTEVPEYKVARGANGEGPIATNCLFWQPSPSLGDKSSSYVNYTYRVPRPHTAILTKIADTPGSSGLTIMLTVQPVDQERSIAWILYSVQNATKPEAQLRARQELVFMQDKGILENQLPKRLPLDAGAEVPIVCDRLSVAYRHYLRERGVTFGAG